MCGIFGCVGRIEYEVAKKCAMELRHRGPDGMGIGQYNDATLCHTRLSILDLSDSANMPMSDISGRYHLVYNGEVYNFLEIRKELIEKGYRFCTESDSEVVLYSYIEWGKDFLNKMNGMWAIAIYDSIERELFIARDRFGIKPLYYYSDNDSFFFASEQKALFPIMNNRIINYKFFEKGYVFGHESREEGLIYGIKKIPAGCYGIYRDGELEVSRWWSTIDNIVDVPKTYEEQVELFRELFLDACKIRMRSDVSIGTALSGGVDSSAVVGAMHYIAKTGGERIANDWQNVYTANLANTSLDEIKYAKIAADYVGLDLNIADINPRISFEHLLEYMRMCDDPYSTSPIAFIQTYERMSKDGVKVSIDGHGADELFGGYDFDAVYAYHDCETEEDRQILWNTINELNSVTGHKITYEEFGKIADGKKIKKNGQLGALNSKLYSEVHTEILPTLLRCYDRYSMINGVEIRMPFMDYRIVSFAFSIPWTSKVNYGYNKVIVRDMASAFMDSQITRRKDKMGFHSPMTEWIKGDMREMFIDIISSKDFKECELINYTEAICRMNKLLSAQECGYKDGYDAWCSIAPYLWKKALKL